MCNGNIFVSINNLVVETIAGEKGSFGGQLLMEVYALNTDHVSVLAKLSEGYVLFLGESIYSHLYKMNL